MFIQDNKMSCSFSAVNSSLAQEFMSNMQTMDLIYNAVVLLTDIFSQLAVEDWDEKVKGFVSRNGTIS